MFVKTYAQDFIKIINQSEKNKDDSLAIKNNNICEGTIIVNNEKYIFKRIEVVKGRLNMSIPSHFKLMSKNAIDFKYHGKDAPDVVYTNESTDINISFSIDKVDVISSDVLKISEIIIDQLKRIYKGSTFKEIKIIEKENIFMTYFSFDVPVVDGEIYMYMFFLESMRDLLIGTISFDTADKDAWDDLSVQMLNTIEIIENKDLKK